MKLNISIFCRVSLILNVHFRILLCAASRSGWNSESYRKADIVIIFIRMFFIFITQSNFDSDDDSLNITTRVLFMICNLFVLANKIESLHHYEQNLPKKEIQGDRTGQPSTLN